MIEKGKLYRFFESLVPPLLLAPIKKSALYRGIAKRADHFTSTPRARIVTITEGLLSGYKLKFNPDGTWQKEMLSGNYDNELFTALVQYNLTNEVIYDIGAHICYHSLAFAQLVGPQGHVYAFEPNTINSERAKEILALNTTVQNTISLHEIALGESVGVATFLCSTDLEGGSSTGGFLDNAETIWERSVYIDKIAFKEITVPQDTIDNLIATNKALPPTVLKIDVEGAEQLVLAGAMKTLRNFHPIIIVEFHSIFSAYRCMEILLHEHYTTTILKKEPDGRVMILATHADTQKGH